MLLGRDPLSSATMNEDSQNVSLPPTPYYRRHGRSFHQHRLTDTDQTFKLDLTRPPLLIFIPSRAL